MATIPSADKTAYLILKAVVHGHPARAGGAVYGGESTCAGRGRRSAWLDWITRLSRAG